MKKRELIWFGIAALLALVIALMVSCTGPEGSQGPEGPQGPPGVSASETCSDCHNESDQLVFARSLQWESSGHGEGTSYLRGTSAGCAGCHAGEGFVAMIAAGIGPDEVEEGETNPTPQNCRTCHEIHNTYTDADWALTTEAPVTLYVSGATFDAGAGNLCANCHQPRREMEAENGMVDVDSTHWGPHHGPQAAMLLGIGGAGDASGTPSVHYTAIQDSCVTCHMVDENHTMAANVAACTACHADASDFDIGGAQTEVEELLAELLELLEAKGLYHEGHPVVGEYPEGEAAALWNYIYIATEDSSMGVHNPSYTKALLEASIEALQ